MRSSGLRNNGVTMIELMVSIMIIGLLAGTVTLSLRGMSQRFKREDVVQQIKHIDEQVRLHARLHGVGGQLRFDLRDDVSVIIYVPVGSESGNKERKWEITKPYRLSEVRVVGGEVSRSQIALPVSQDGVMLTYAAKLERDEKTSVQISDLEQDDMVWLVFVGMTGQVLETNKQEEVDAILFAAK